MASRPRFAIANQSRAKGSCIDLVACCVLKNSAVDTIKPTVVVKQVTVTITARKS